MTLPCITKARRFDAQAHQPFWIDAQQVGWIRSTDVPLLARWPDVFDIDARRVALSSRYNTVDMRSAALGGVTRPTQSVMRSTHRRSRISNARRRASSAP
jgi:hypothetical protein